MKRFKIATIGILAIVGLLVAALCSVWLEAPTPVTATFSIGMLVAVWCLEDIEDAETKEEP